MDTSIQDASYEMLDKPKWPLWRIVRFVVSFLVSVLTIMELAAAVALQATLSTLYLFSEGAFIDSMNSTCDSKGKGGLLKLKSYTISRYTILSRHLGMLAVTV